MTKETVLKDFEALKGVGKTKAKLLYDNGFDSMEKLRKATVKNLTKVKGISEKNARDIISQLKEKPVKKTKPSKTKPEQPSETTEKSKETEEQKKPAEQVTIVEEQKGKYKVKRKPVLTESQKKQLVIRRQIKKRTPYFLRDEGFRYKRIPKNWRRPTGYTSKLRINLKYRPSKVRVGFRAPSLVRGLHSSGFEEVMIHTVKDLDAIDPKKQAARIGGTVGTKKRIEIAKRAAELDVRLLNWKG